MLEELSKVFGAVNVAFTEGWNSPKLRYKTKLWSWKNVTKQNNNETKRSLESSLSTITRRLDF